MTFSHQSKAIGDEMKRIVETQIAKMGQIFEMEENEIEDEIEDIVLDDDGGEYPEECTAPSMAVTDEEPFLTTEVTPPVVILIADDDEENEPTDTGESSQDVEKDEDVRTRICREVDAILNAQIEQEMNDEYNVIVLE